MCLQTWLLFVLLSVVSMAMGFYDLWKNVPYFKQFVVGMFRPAAAVFEWLEGHTQVRAVRTGRLHCASGSACSVLAYLSAACYWDTQMLRLCSHW